MALVSSIARRIQGNRLVPEETQHLHTLAIVKGNAESKSEDALDHRHVLIHRVPVRWNAVTVGEFGAEHVRLAGFSEETQILERLVDTG